MKVVLDTGTEYDLENSTRVKNLKGNIRKMVSPKHQDRLKAIVAQLEDYFRDPDAKDGSFCAAMEIHTLLKGMLGAAVDFPIISTSLSQPEPVKVELPILQTVKAPPSIQLPVPAVQVSAEVLPVLTHAPLETAPKDPIPMHAKISGMSEGKELTGARSLALPESVLKVLSEKQGILAKVQHLKAFIVEHAERRVDAFFALLQVYHQSQMRIKLTGPMKQAATGSKVNGTHAAHSSLITGLTDSDIQGNSPMKLRSGRDIPGRDCSKIDKYFFQSVLPSTVELVQGVNYFDAQLEGKIEAPSKLRGQALEILNQVSAGGIDPIEGTRRFLIATKDFFVELEKSYVRCNSKTAPSDARKLILEYEREGALKNLITATEYLVPDFEDQLKYYLTRSPLIVESVPNSGRSALAFAGLPALFFDDPEEELAPI